MTGPLANEFAQVRQALVEKSWRDGREECIACGRLLVAEGHAIGCVVEPALAALARIEKHVQGTENLVRAAHWVRGTGYETSSADVTVLRDAYDALGEALAALSAGEGTPA